MKSAVIACQNSNHLVEKLKTVLDKLQVRNTIVYANDNEANSVLQSQIRESNNSIDTSMRDIFSQLDANPIDCVVYDIINPPLISGVAEAPRMPSIAIYNYQVGLLQAAIQQGVSKYIRVSCYSETLMDLFLKGNWESNTFTQYDPISTVYRLASRDMGRLLSYLGKLDFVNTRLSAIIDTNNFSIESLRMWQEELSKHRKSLELDVKLSVDAISTDNAAAALSQLGFNSNINKDFYIGAGNFHDLDQVATLLGSNSRASSPSDGVNPILISRPDKLNECEDH
jgi:hypothetical protein